MKLINAYASERQYLNKLLPIWDALPDEIKGQLTVHARLDGIKHLTIGPPVQDGILMVASQKDSLYAKDKFIYVEHGAGQTYDPNDFYANTHRPNMLAALVPGPYCAEKTMRANPGVPVIPIGAPHLAEVQPEEPQQITFAWHWRCGVAIEANTAFDEYAEAMVECSTKWGTAGHGHPRILGEIIPFYQAHGIRVRTDSADALAHTGLLVADNTSLIYEAALLDIPVVLVNSSSWRRSRSWGLRFWDALPGPQVDKPEDLMGVLEEQVAGGFVDWSSARRQSANLVYGPHPFERLDKGIAILMGVVYDYARYR